MGGALAFSCSNCRFGVLAVDKGVGVLAVDKGVGVLANKGFDRCCTLDCGTVSVTNSCRCDSTGPSQREFQYKLLSISPTDFVRFSSRVFTSKMSFANSVNFSELSLQQQLPYVVKMRLNAVNGDYELPLFTL